MAMEYKNFPLASGDGGWGGILRAWGELPSINVAPGSGGGGGG